MAVLCQAPESIRGVGVSKLFYLMVAVAAGVGVGSLHAALLGPGQQLVQ